MDHEDLDHNLKKVKKSKKRKKFKKHKKKRILRSRSRSYIDKKSRRIRRRNDGLYDEYDGQFTEYDGNIGSDRYRAEDWYDGIERRSRSMSRDNKKRSQPKGYWVFKRGSSRNRYRKRRKNQTKKRNHRHRSDKRRRSLSHHVSPSPNKKRLKRKKKKKRLKREDIIKMYLKLKIMTKILRIAQMMIGQN